jgi:phospholipid/cholesterol/gamma-HCH transport system permease protein
MNSGRTPAIGLLDGMLFPVRYVGDATIGFVVAIGDMTLFLLETISWFLSTRLAASTLWPNMYRIGVLSLPVILVTGAFIGMVLAVQTYDQLKMMGLENHLGSVINISLVKELGPVLAATMLAGRVGCAMSAELATMRVTEQVDALLALGANPVHYLVVPRFLSCLVLIPVLALVADGVGMLSGWLFSSFVLGIDTHYYWHHSSTYVTLYDCMIGIVKSIFFGAAIGTVACHRGFYSAAGAEGVGKAATESFVFSFVMILFLDFILGVFMANLYWVLFGAPQMMF